MHIVRATVFFNWCRHLFDWRCDACCVCGGAATESFPRGVLAGHTDAVWSLAFSPRGYNMNEAGEDVPLLLSASADRTVRLWSFSPFDTGSWCLSLSIYPFPILSLWSVIMCAVHSVVLPGCLQAPPRV